jgi:acyl-CoA reductase-like NAD-dependent aldehyde dehydrogenase
MRLANASEFGLAAEFTSDVNAAFRYARIERRRLHQRRAQARPDAIGGVKQSGVVTKARDTTKR